MCRDAKDTSRLPGRGVSLHPLRFVPLLLAAQRGQRGT